MSSLTSIGSVRLDKALLLSVVIGNLLLIAHYYFSLSALELDHLFFNSDTLYLPSLYRDLFVHGNSLDGWMLNSAPNFFPDMLIYFIIMSISDNIPLAALVFSMIQYCMIAIAVHGLFKVLLPHRAAFNSIVSHLIFALVLFIQNVEFTFQFLSNAYHLGAFVNALIAWNLLLRSKKGRFKFLIYLAIVVFLASLSDGLFHVIFTIPALMSWTLSQWKIKRNDRYWAPGLLLIVASVLAKLAYNSFPLWTGADFAETQEIPRLELVGSSFQNFGAHVWGFINEFSILSLFIILTLGALLATAHMGWRSWLKASDRTPNQRAWELGLPIMMFLILFTPPLVGSYTGRDSIRYNYAAYGLVPIAFSYLIYKYKLDHSIGRPAKVLAAILLPLAVVLVVRDGYNEKGISKYSNYYPARVERVDAYAAQLASRYCVADFWNAKVITMFSKKGLRVYPVYYNLYAHEHVLNRNWYRRSMEDPSKKAVFRAVITSDHLLPENIRSEITSNALKIGDDATTILLTEPFVYESGELAPKFQK